MDDGADLLSFHVRSVASSLRSADWPKGSGAMSPSFARSSCSWCFGTADSKLLNSKPLVTSRGEMELTDPQEHPEDSGQDSGGGTPPQSHRTELSDPSEAMFLRRSRPVGSRRLSVDRPASGGDVLH